MKKTINEALMLVKQKESEIYRLAQQRNKTVGFEMDKTAYLGAGDDYTKEDYNKAVEKFNEEQKAKLADIDEKLYDLYNDVLQIRNVINKANVEGGQDKRLITMKWLRIELKNLQEICFSSGYMFKGYSKRADELGLIDKLRSLEEEKNRLDAEIQKFNHDTTVELKLNSP